jgi:uncharacterized protein Yka (UPF0111/DUF47 family)
MNRLSADGHAAPQRMDAEIDELHLEDRIAKLERRLDSMSERVLKRLLRSERLKAGRRP